MGLIYAMRFFVLLKFMFFLLNPLLCVSLLIWTFSHIVVFFTNPTVVTRLPHHILTFLPRLHSFTYDSNNGTNLRLFCMSNYDSQLSLMYTKSYTWFSHTHLNLRIFTLHMKDLITTFILPCFFYKTGKLFSLVFVTSVSLLFCPIYFYI